MNFRYDIAIVGSGPAGLSAAVNAKIRNKSIIVFGKKELSNKLIKAPKIKNYLGLPDITGVQLKEKFEEHIKSMGINITPENINEIYATFEKLSRIIGIFPKKYPARVMPPTHKTAPTTLYVMKVP